MFKICVLLNKLAAIIACLDFSLNYINVQISK